MPTVLKLDGYRVVIYPSDHRPSHVHVIGSGSEAVFLLSCPDGPVELRESFNCKETEIGQIRSKLAEHLSSLCAEWRRIHGQF